MKKELRVIDIDFVRELRRTGNSASANSLLRAYYSDLRKTKKNAGQVYDKHTRLIKKSKSICVNVQSLCKGKAYKYGLCKRCFDYEHSLCDCGNAIKKHNTKCQKCKVKDKINKSLSGFEKKIYPIFEIKEIIRKKLMIKRSSTLTFFHHNLRKYFKHVKGTTYNVQYKYLGGLR